ncbi:hypothetical protein M0R45_003302 [Rubus argutus]|uniref:Uncharacterized protein n=1 Tax=Rubus argutus TaxID=59490 RepID=A0AAW1YF23_RUBAR
MGKKRKLGQVEALLQTKKQKQMPIVIFVDGAGKQLESSKQVGLIQANLLPNPKVELKPAELIANPKTELNSAAELSSNPVPKIEAKPAELLPPNTVPKDEVKSEELRTNPEPNVEAKPAEPTLKKKNKKWLKRSEKERESTVTTCVDNAVEAKINEEEDDLLRKPGLTVTTGVDVRNNVEARVNEEGEVLTKTGLTETVGDVKNKRIRKRKRKEKKETESTIVDELLPNPVPNVEAKPEEVIPNPGPTPEEKEKKRMRKMRRKEKQKEMEKQHVEQLLQLLNLPGPTPEEKEKKRMKKMRQKERRKQHIEQLFQLLNVPGPTPEEKEKKRMRKMRQKERRKERRKEMEKRHDEQLFQLLNPPMPEITLTEKDTESTEKKVAAKEVEIKYVEICVICRRKGHSIPTCPELIDKSKRSTEETQTKKKKMMPRKKNKSGNKLPECPQPLKDVEMKNGKEEKLLGCPPGNTFMKDETTGGKEDESIVNNGQEEKLLGCPPEDTLMKDEISDDKEDESIVKKGEEEKKDTLMKDENFDETSGGKEEESIVKKGEEEKLLGCPPEDTLMKDEISDDKEDESIVKIDSACHPEERSRVKPMIEQGPEMVNTVA